MPDPAPSLAQMLAALKRQAGSPDKAPPPVGQWNPAHCGEIAMEILADGTWRHEGAPITRESLVRLFASIMDRWRPRWPLRTQPGGTAQLQLR